MKSHDQLYRTLEGCVFWESSKEECVMNFGVTPDESKKDMVD